MNSQTKFVRHFFKFFFSRLSSGITRLYSPISRLLGFFPSSQEHSEAQVRIRIQLLAPAKRLHV